MVAVLLSSLAWGAGADPDADPGVVEAVPAVVAAEPAGPEAGRLAVTEEIGTVTNDPLLRRRLIGATVTWYASDVFALELSADGAADHQERDFKPLMSELASERVLPQGLTKLVEATSLAFTFSPLRGKAVAAFTQRPPQHRAGADERGEDDPRPAQPDAEHRTGPRSSAPKPARAQRWAAEGPRLLAFDVYGLGGAGLALTHDVLAGTDDASTGPSLATAAQWHPTLVAGAGLSVSGPHGVSVRLEARGTSFVETVAGSGLDAQTDVLALAGVTCLVPPVRKPARIRNTSG